MQYIQVKDLEVELETDRQKSKENLQQALLIERERFTQMQWDMEELRQKSLEMELRLKSKSEKVYCTFPVYVLLSRYPFNGFIYALMKLFQDEKTCAESRPKNSSAQEKDVLLQELDSSKQQLEILTKQYEELEVKSKADRKVLVKEVKSLRSSQSKLEHELSKLLQEKSEAEVVYFSAMVNFCIAELFLTSC